MDINSAIESSAPAELCEATPPAGGDTRETIAGRLGATSSTRRDSASDPGNPKTSSWLELATVPGVG